MKQSVTEMSLDWKSNQNWVQDPMYIKSNKILKFLKVEKNLVDVFKRAQNVILTLCNTFGDNFVFFSFPEGTLKKEAYPSFTISCAVNMLWKLELYCVLWSLKSLRQRRMSYRTTLRINTCSDQICMWAV